MHRCERTDRGLPGVRHALLTSAMGYTIGIISLNSDIGRPRNIWRVLVLWGEWNLDSVLLDPRPCDGDRHLHPRRPPSRPARPERGVGAVYFPSVMELIMTVGLIAIQGTIHLLVVKDCPLLAAQHARWSC